QRLLLTVQRAAEQHALRREVVQLRSERAGAADLGSSRAAAELQRTLDLVAAQTSLSVLLVGESGTGKEVVAREVHRRSPVQGGPFVAIDCGALPEPLLESQLFGHKRGAFTGADRDRQGLFQMAHGGTLFLDELGNLAPALQQKLLRALQERAAVPVGGSEPVGFQARLLGATNALLGEDMRAGRFRVALYHRVAEFTLRLPPLRERPDDVLHFARRFLADANAEMGREVRGIAAAAQQVLVQHSWPGNRRGLRSVPRRGVLLCTDGGLGAEHLERRRAPPTPTPAVTPAPSPDDGALPLAERIRRASDALEAEILRQ